MPGFPDQIDFCRGKLRNREFDNIAAFFKNMIQKEGGHGVVGYQLLDSGQLIGADDNIEGQSFVMIELADTVVQESVLRQHCQWESVQVFDRKAVFGCQRVRCSNI